MYWTFAVNDLTMHSVALLHVIPGVSTVTDGVPVVSRMRMPTDVPAHSEILDAIELYAAGSMISPTLAWDTF